MRQAFLFLAVKKFIGRVLVVLVTGVISWPWIAGLIDWGTYAVTGQQLTQIVWSDVGTTLGLLVAWPVVTVLVGFAITAMAGFLLQ